MSTKIYTGLRPITQNKIFFSSLVQHNLTRTIYTQNTKQPETEYNWECFKQKWCGAWDRLPHTDWICRRIYLNCKKKNPYTQTKASHISYFLSFILLHIQTTDTDILNFPIFPKCNSMLLTPFHVFCMIYPKQSTTLVVGQNFVLIM